MTTFDLALAFTLPAEGGLVNDASDPGGKTNKGITQHTFDSYRDSLKQSRQDVSLITDAEVCAIYQEMYWNPGHCSDMVPSLGIAHFDTCVNMGVNSAIKMLQRAAGLDDDGIYGNITAAEVTHQGKDLVIPYLDERRARYRAIVAANPALEKFAKGWATRVNALEDYMEDK